MAIFPARISRGGCLHIHVQLFREVHAWRIAHSPQSVDLHAAKDLLIRARLLCRICASFFILTARAPRRIFMLEMPV